MELSHKEIAYLLGCYVIIEDKEINSRELSVLNDFLPLQKDSQLYEERKKIFQDDETKISIKELLSKLSHLHLNKEESEKTYSFSRAHIFCRLLYGFKGKKSCGEDS